MTTAKPMDAGTKYLHDLALQNAGLDTSGLTGIAAAAAQYPAFAAFMGIPEVAALLNDAANQGWTQDQFALHLANTGWWKSNSDTQREWQALTLYDPAKAAQQKAQKIGEVTAEAGKLGVTLDANQIQYIATGALAGGWDQTTLQRAIAGNAQAAKDAPGQIAATQTQLNNVAASYGVPVSPHTTFDWAKKIAMGTADATGFGEYAKQQAKIAHPYWESQLDQGLTVRQLADPYIQQASKLLEIAPDQVDLTDHKWTNAFVQTNKQGQAQPMSQLDWSKKLMTDPTYGWDKTMNARNAALQIQDTLRTAFGAQ
jgi:hypothetical protein